MYKYGFANERGSISNIDISINCLLGASQWRAIRSLGEKEKIMLQHLCAGNVGNCRYIPSLMAPKVGKG